MFSEITLTTVRVSSRTLDKLMARAVSMGAMEKRWSALISSLLLTGSGWVAQAR